MNRVNMTQFITTDNKDDHITTMQDVSFSFSFSFYVTGDVQLVQAAVKAVRESDSYYSVKVDGNVDDADFEFETLPLREDSFFHFPTTTTTLTSKLSSDDNDVATNRVTSKDLFYGGWNIDDHNPPSLPSPFESENHLPTKKYCFWNPIRSLVRGDNSKSKRSSSAPKRCLLKELLRRSHSDGAVSSSSASKQCLLKNLLRRSYIDGGECLNSPSVNVSPAVKGRNKTGSYSPEVVKRRKY